ncbi:MAG: RDD family protein [Candidatus Eiseniibacteriota bacterium]
MKTCTLCQAEVTPRMVREGAAIERGSELFHRECHRGIRGSATAPLPKSRPLAASPRETTSFPDIPVSAELAGFWRRFGAHLIDGLILNVVVFFAGLCIGFGAGVTGVFEPSAATVLGGLIGAVVPLVYFVWFWVRKGATPGKLAMGIRIVGPDNRPPTGMAAFVRFIGYIPSGLFLGLGYLWMLFDGEKRCWHDMMAGTRVVRVS